MTWERHNDVFLWQPTGRLNWPPLFRIEHREGEPCVSVRNAWFTDLADYPDVDELCRATEADLEVAIAELVNVPPDWPFPHDEAPELLRSCREVIRKINA